ncbi:hypothetical protein E1J25_17175 [Xanthomonas hortorum pv. taraxaci]|nr:hypothetical protein [Xanthomonas hortorum pv. taraxaci]
MSFNLVSGFAPYPHPNPRSAPRPALAARALQGTRASGVQAVPYRPAGREASSFGLMLAVTARLQAWRRTRLVMRRGMCPSLGSALAW